jgi:hypothetical protein
MAVPRRSPAAGFLIAIAAVLTTVVRYLLRGVLGDTFVYTLYMLPVMLAGWYGGLRPALVATIASAVLSVTYIEPPVGRFELDSSTDVLRLVLFVLCALIVSALWSPASLSPAGPPRKRLVAPPWRAPEGGGRLRSAMEAANLTAFEWDPQETRPPACGSQSGTHWGGISSGGRHGHRIEPGMLRTRSPRACREVLLPGRVPHQ